MEATTMTARAKASAARRRTYAAPELRVARFAAGEVFADNGTVYPSDEADTNMSGSDLGLGE